jgi:hypothetical protein
MTCPLRGDQIMLLQLLSFLTTLHSYDFLLQNSLFKERCPSVFEVIGSVSNMFLNFIYFLSWVRLTFLSILSVISNSIVNFYIELTQDRIKGVLPRKVTIIILSKLYFILRTENKRNAFEWMWTSSVPLRTLSNISVNHSVFLYQNLGFVTQFKYFIMLLCSWKNFHINVAPASITYIKLWTVIK